MSELQTFEMYIRALPEKITLELWRENDSPLIFLDEQELKPQVSQAVWNKSPDGFEWGYEGSGPAQLSLAILLRYLPEPLALRWFQGFKRKFVAAYPRGGGRFYISLRKAIQEIEDERS
jgi:hypothetical protein